jgi:peptidyl-prolyl cis-trans isomerase A (cyclophilin A)
MRRFEWGAAGAALLLSVAGCSRPGGASSDAKKEATAPQRVEKTPDVFKLNLDTSKGVIVIEVHKDWAPIGVDHLFELVKTGYYDGNRFFRVTQRYAQFGINGDPKLNGLWSNAFLPDDPVKQSNVKGSVAFAHLGPNNRTTQLFFNLKDNKDLDKGGFAPIGKVISGMEVVERLYSSYGDMPPRGQGPDPSKIETQGNPYLESHFPRLDYVRKATIQ